MRKLSLLFACAMVAGCASTREPANVRESPPQPVDNAGEFRKTVDIKELAAALGMTTTDLGFHEKTFNSCSLPQELRTSPACESKYFTRINFQVMCRDSIGTVEETVSESSLKPMVANRVAWVLGKIRGSTSIDADGNGHVLALSSKSTSQRALILKVKNLALGVTAVDVRRIVVPANWCM